MREGTGVTGERSHFPPALIRERSGVSGRPPIAFFKKWSALPPQKEGGDPSYLPILFGVRSEQPGKPVPAGVLAFLHVLAVDAGRIEGVPGGFTVMD